MRHKILIAMQDVFSDKILQHSVMSANWMKPMSWIVIKGRNYQKLLRADPGNMGPRQGKGAFPTNMSAFAPVYREKVM